MARLLATANVPSADTDRESIPVPWRNRFVPNRRVAPAGSGSSGTAVADGPGTAAAGGVAARGCTRFGAPDAITQPAKAAVRTPPATATGGSQVHRAAVAAR